VGTTTRGIAAVGRARVVVIPAADIRVVDILVVDIRAAVEVIPVVAVDNVRAVVGVAHGLVWMASKSCSACAARPADVSLS
jgi:hypothetical protein